MIDEDAGPRWRTKSRRVFLISDQDLQTDFDAYLARQAQKDTLRFITCGSVDDIHPDRTPSP